MHFSLSKILLSTVSLQEKHICVISVDVIPVTTCVCCLRRHCISPLVSFMLSFKDKFASVCFINAANLQLVEIVQHTAANFLEKSASSCVGRRMAEAFNC